MRLEAILHIPMSEYAHCVSESRVIFRLRAARGDLAACDLYYGDRACRVNPVIFTRESMRVVFSDLLFDYWEAEFDTPYTRLCYYFALDGGAEKTLYYADFFSGHTVPDRSEYYQLPFVHRADIAAAPDWSRDAVVYNIFPDSFATSRRHISLKPTAQNFGGETTRGKLGGTIRGITGNADYLQELGVSCVYLNPIFAAGEYHKYDLIDYYHIDPCFGTDGDFAEMVDALHAKGIRVLIDGVFNHCGWRFFAFDDVVRRGEKSRYKDWFYRLDFPVTRPEDQATIPGYECFAYERMMPKLNTTNPEVRDYFLDVCRYWLREYKIDGWRLDVASEADDGFWRAFRQAAREVNPDALLIGEIWENASHWLGGDMFHGAMNYDFRRHCRDFFARETIGAETFSAGVTHMLLRYRKNLLYSQLNLLDSHDVSRFLTLCGGDTGRLKLAVLFQMCFVGIPSIFYGDEQGFAGAAEDEYRRPMRWDGDRDMLLFYQRAIRLRRAHAALRRGSFEIISAQGRSFVFRRAVEQERVVVALNAGRSELPPGEVLWAGENFIVVKEV